MNAAQQHMLDLYRSARLGHPAPPAPGTGDVETFRSFRTWLAFRAVVDERVAARRARRSALLRFLLPRTPVRPAARPSAARPAAVRPYPAQESPCPHPAQDGTPRIPDTCGRPAEC
ncbi:hypothetical protein [Streptomyces sp. NPDC008001]|uniref:hypothetical protein n=1 Tax=Streptomyces sp. NPDC008001 TaxID=3364804 RepID=UPI0036EBCE22